MKKTKPDWVRDMQRKYFTGRNTYVDSNGVERWKSNNKPVRAKGKLKK